LNALKTGDALRQDLRSALVALASLAVSETGYATEDGVEVETGAGAALQTLAQNQTVKPHVEAVLKALKDENASLRLAALQVLSHAGCPAGLEPLCEALGDEKASVQVAAAAALAQAVESGRFRVAHVDALLLSCAQRGDLSALVREACLSAVVSRVNNTLLQRCCCEEESEATPPASTSVAVEPASERVAGALRLLAASEEAPLRRLAIIGLGRAGDLSFALEAMSDEHPNVRTAAALVACEVGGVVPSTEGLGRRQKKQALSEQQV
jgi:HEAT repeat protein